MAKKVLYLGLSLPEALQEQATVVHYPIIRITPRLASDPDIRDVFNHLDAFTHFLFTSKTAVDLFVQCLDYYGKSVEIVGSKKSIAVGQATAKRLNKYGIQTWITATRESSEGIIEALDSEVLQNAYFFWPHSALSRPLLLHFFKNKGIRYRDCVLYDTVEQNSHPKPSLDTIEEIIFTSPSTVDAFLSQFGIFPKNKTLTPIGEVTEKHLDEMVFLTQRQTRL